MGYRVAVAGASGYAGGELLRLLLAPSGRSRSRRHWPPATPARRLGDCTRICCRSPTWCSPRPPPRRWPDADWCSWRCRTARRAALAAELAGRTPWSIDLGADHRLTDPAAWQRWYGGDHAGSWPYGLPELPGQRERIAGATRVANTGCYADGGRSSALAPLLAAGLVEPDDVVVVAASGTSGAGRSAQAAPARQRGDG